MRCPRCGAEIQNGLDRCLHCDEPPTVRPQPDPSHEGEDLVILVSITDVGLLPVIKSLLDGVGIPYIVQGEEALGLLPVGAFSGGVSPGALSANILVPGDRLEEAQALLRQGASDPGSENDSTC